MMEIANARITHVEVSIDDRDRLSARMTFKSQHTVCDWGFILSNPVDVQRLKMLMNYTGSYDVMNLDGKIIRRVNSDCFMRGFGHPIEDKFVPFFTKKFTEISEAEFETMLASK